MKSDLLKVSILLVPLLVTVVFSTVSEASAIKPFGGVVINTKATEIESLENSNYKCTVPGSTITIRSKGRSAPTTYLIPSNARSKTNTMSRSNQHILGLYTQSKTSITCVFQGTPPSSTTVQLTPIRMYGTSR